MPVSATKVRAPVLIFLEVSRPQSVPEVERTVKTRVHFENRDITRSAAEIVALQDLDTDYPILAPRARGWLLLIVPPSPASSRVLCCLRCVRSKSPDGNDGIR